MLQLVASACAGETVVELVADGVHVHPELVHDVVRFIETSDAGPLGAIFVTDAMAGAGMPDGSYELGGLVVTITDGVAMLADGRPSRVPLHGLPMRSSEWLAAAFSRWSRWFEPVLPDLHGLRVSVTTPQVSRSRSGRAYARTLWCCRVITRLSRLCEKVSSLPNVYPFT